LARKLAPLAAQTAEVPDAVLAEPRRARYGGDRDHERGRHDPRSRHPHRASGNGKVSGRQPEPAKTICYWSRAIRRNGILRDPDPQHRPAVSV
jgi:hypothetical protein